MVLSRSIACALALITTGVLHAQQPADVPPAAVPASIDPPVEVAGEIPPVGAVSADAVVPGILVADVPNGSAVVPPTTPRLNDFQGDPIDLVLRTLARQARLNIVVSDQVSQTGGAVNMRIEDKTAKEAIEIIVESKGLYMDEGKGGVYYIKTQAEKQKEPTESGSFTLSYAQAKDIIPLLQTQLQSGIAPQFDQRTNTLFYRENRSNIEKVSLFLETVDKPTQQVMIEARLVEVTANPNQSYGINWAGTFGSANSGKTFKVGAGPIPDGGTYKFDQGSDGSYQVYDTILGSNGFPLNATQPRGTLGADFARYAAGQFSILSAPQLSATLRLLNEDNDAEFLANPRVVTANNLEAKIKITRSQPVPQLNFNEQTAQAVFSGFQDKEFGNTLTVMPSINKDNFISLLVKPEISNKVGDATFTFGGAVVTSPVIDKRELNSNVLIKSGDTLAIGGLLQDEQSKAATKVPILGDIPILGYAFQQKINSRVKRNLLIFVTPTVIEQGYGTGLEDQVSGLTHSGAEYADPNGWRNNAKGAKRIVPTSHRSLAADVPKPGIAPMPRKVRR